MLELLTTRQFERDLKRLKKQQKNLDKLWDIVEQLLAQESLPLKHKPLPLIGNWKPCRECHLEPDWLLIWESNLQSLNLIRTGSHSDLFR